MAARQFMYGTLILIIMTATLLPSTLRAAETGPYRVLTSIRPATLLVTELAGNLPIRVDTLLPAGATPHDYALSPSDLTRIRQADLLVWLGESGEPYLRKVSAANPNRVAWGELPDLLKLPAREALHASQGDSHDSHDSHHHHDHGDTGIDPHIWWSVPNAILLARTLEQQIAAARPEWAAPLQQNRLQLEATLQRQVLDQRARFASGFKPFLLAHDAFHYLEEDLGIQSDAAILLDPEAKPGVKHLLELKKRVQAQNIGCVLTGVLVPGNLIDKIDTDPPLLRQPMDELGWDYPGNRYSEWLQLAYDKVAECVGLSLN